MKLLVVEDDPRLARILVRNLEDRGHTADVVETGATAVERGRAGRFAVAIEAVRGVGFRLDVTT